MRRTVIRVAAGAAVALGSLGAVALAAVPAGAAGPNGVACVAPGPQSTSTGTAPTASAGGYAGFLASGSWSITWTVNGVAGTGFSGSTPGPIQGASQTVIPAGAIITCTITGAGSLVAGSPTG